MLGDNGNSKSIIWCNPSTSTDREWIQPTPPTPLLLETLIQTQIHMIWTIDPGSKDYDATERVLQDHVAAERVLGAEEEALQDNDLGFSSLYLRSSLLLLVSWRQPSSLSPSSSLSKPPAMYPTIYSLHRRFRMLDSACWIPHVGFRMLDFACWIPHVGFRM